MSLNDQFDKLARQKLEERAFPFDEGAWLQAEKAIGKQRRRRRWMLWFIPGLLLTGLVAWWALPTAEERLTASPVSQGEQQVQVVEVTSSDSAEWDGTMAHEAPRMEQTGPGSVSRPKASSSALVNEPTARGSKSPDPVERVAEAAPGNGLSQPMGSRAQPSIDARVHDADGSGRRIADASATTPASGGVRAYERDRRPAAMPDETSALGPRTDARAAADAGAASTPPQQLDPSGQPSVADAPQPGGAAAMDDAHAGEPEPVAATTAPTAADSTIAREDDMAVSDSTGASAPEPALQLVSPRSPWELSASVGLASTTSRYGSAEQAGWSVTPERTAAFGVEAMRMGRNFGYGFGLHHGTYADRLSTPEAGRSVSETSRYWFLVPVDTTLLIITDSAFNGQGQMEYYGISVPTTVMVLQSAFETTTTRSIIRQARQRVNRTSYVELPLLLDAHLVQGRWSFGVRGGPAIGMLTTRSGSVPGEGPDGYEELGEVFTRRYVLGWTARAYVRYRFNSAWSIGLEPGARGQLQDGFASPSVTRRSDALGVSLSLSYRLR